MAGSTKRSLAVIEGGSPDGTADDLVGAVKRYLDAVVLPLRTELAVCKAELEALKSRPEPQPRDGLPGVPGAPGAPGVPGAPGRDGLGFDDVSMAYDGERKFTFKVTNGERVKEFAFIVPIAIYREVYRQGVAYMKGDQVSFGGSIWHCLEPTVEKPGAGCKKWRLASKHGRDGRDGKSAYEVAVDQGFKGSETEWLKSLRGPEGPRGQDLRHLMPGGA